MKSLQLLFVCVCILTHDYPLGHFFSFSLYTFTFFHCLISITLFWEYFSPVLYSGGQLLAVLQDAASILLGAQVKEEQEEDLFWKEQMLLWFVTRNLHPKQMLEPLITKGLIAVCAVTIRQWRTQCRYPLGMFVIELQTKWLSWERPYLLYRSLGHWDSWTKASSLAS